MAVQEQQDLRKFKKTLGRAASYAGLEIPKGFDPKVKTCGGPCHRLTAQANDFFDFKAAGDAATYPLLLAMRQYNADMAKREDCGLDALTTTSPRTGVVWAAALCQIAVDEKATAIAATSGRMRYPMKLSRYGLIYWWARILVEMPGVGNATNCRAAICPIPRRWRVRHSLPGCLSRSVLTPAPGMSMKTPPRLRQFVAMAPSIFLSKIKLLHGPT